MILSFYGNSDLIKEGVSFILKKKNACSLSCHELNKETDSIIMCVFSQTQSWIAYLSKDV